MCSYCRHCRESLRTWLLRWNIFASAITCLNPPRFHVSWPWPYFKDPVLLTTKRSIGLYFQHLGIKYTVKWILHPHSIILFKQVFRLSVCLISTTLTQGARKHQLEYPSHQIWLWDWTLVLFDVYLVNSFQIDLWRGNFIEPRQEPYLP